MARQSTTYSTFLTRWCALVGIPTDRLTTELAASANAGFNNAINDMWQRGPWMEVCPTEARFCGNQLSYGNNLANSAYWTTTAVTPTANATYNPLDGRQTATKVLETSATSAHKLVQSNVNFFPNTNYQITAYIRPNGRNYAQISVYDGASTYSAFYNLSTGAVGTTSGVTGSTIGQQPNGFWLCQFTFTSSATANSSGTYTVSVSTDGSTLSYAGDATKGLYVWGAVVQQTGNVSQNELVLPWDQAGETEIDAVFDVYKTNPVGSSYPPKQTFELTPNGVQLIFGTWTTYYVNGVLQQNLYGTVPCSPVYVYFRKVCPAYSGDDYSATATYAVDDQIYYDGDYWKCIVATTAGQSPDTTPNSWERLVIPATFLDFCTFNAYGDWLISDGQLEKAQAAYAIAQSKMDDQFDIFERQGGQVLPMNVGTHLTARAAYYH